MTDADARAYLAELEYALNHVQDVPRPPAHRRRRTGEMTVTDIERRAMQAFHLLDGATYADLARLFRRDPHYIPQWVWDPQYIALCEYLQGGAQRHAA